MNLWSNTDPNFNPRSPHGERRANRLHRNTVAHRISIHAPRTGSDLPLEIYFLVLVEFQSTLPARGATRSKCRCRLEFGISIHAPRTGSDLAVSCMRMLLSISIHAPRTGSDSRMSCFK